MADVLVPDSDLIKDVDKVDNLQQTLREAESLFQKGEDKKGGEYIRKAAKQFTASHPDISEYVPSISTSEQSDKALRVQYKTEITQTLSRIVEQKISQGNDPINTIAEVAEAIVPQYSEDQNLAKIGDKQQTLEQLLSLDGMQCRHQAIMTAKLAFSWINSTNQGDKYSVKSVQFPNGVIFNGQPLPKGHYFIEIDDNQNSKIGFIDTTNPYLAKDETGKIIQKPKEEALKSLFLNYKENTLEVPSLEAQDWSNFNVEYYQNDSLTKG